MVWEIRRGSAVIMGMLLLPVFVGCHTYEVRQFDSVKAEHPIKLVRAAVIMKLSLGAQMLAEIVPGTAGPTKQQNKLFTEQLIVSLQKRGVDVAERQKVESLLVDARMIEEGLADLTETERAKRLGRLLKVDVIIYGDAIVNSSFYVYNKRPFFNDDDERFRLQREANETGVVDLKGYPVLAHHSIGLSIHAVDSATGEIVWVGYRFLATATEVDEDRPDTLTNFEVIRNVSDEIIDDLLQISRF